MCTVRLLLYGGLPDRDPPRQGPSWTETPLDRDPPDRYTPQTETPWTETETPAPVDRQTTSENITFPQLRLQAVIRIFINFIL